MSDIMLVYDFNFHYEVKYFKFFNRNVESFTDQGSAEVKFVALVNSGEWDAVYLYCDGRILESWAENYDEDGGGHFEELRYLKSIPSLFVVRERDDRGELTDPYSVKDRRYPAYRGNFVVIDKRDSGSVGPYLDGVTLEVAGHLADTYNDLYRLWVVAKAAREVAAENDASFARELLTDGLSIFGDWLEVSE